MNEQQIIEWAREAGFESNDSGDYVMDSTAWVCDVESIERLIALVAAHAKAEERERSILCLERNADKPIDEIISAIRALKD